MSWFQAMMGKPPRNVTPGKVRNELFEGTWLDAQKADASLMEALTKVMDFALNAQPEGGSRGVRAVGDRMVFGIKGIVVGCGDTEKVAGDYEVEVRKVG